MPETKIIQKNDRLFIEFWRDELRIEGSGAMVMHPNSILEQSIDVTAHIERAVENVMKRRKD